MFSKIHAIFSAIILFLLLIFSTFNAASQTTRQTEVHDANPGAKFVALVIGNQSTMDNPDLRGVDNDASDIANYLKNLGFKIINEDRLLNLGKDQMSAYLEQFVANLDPTTIAVFYYSGHGLEESGVNFLVPSDKKLENSLDVHNNLIDLNYWLKRMQTREVRTRVVILDACRDMPRRLSLKGIANEGLEIFTQIGEGTKLVYAASPGKKAYPAQENERNSVFTHAFLQAASENHDTFDGLITRAGLLTRIKSNDKQRPWVSGELGISFRISKIFIDSSPRIMPPQPKKKEESLVNNCEEISIVDTSSIPPIYKKINRCK